MNRSAIGMMVAILLATLGVAWVLSRGKAAGPIFTDVTQIERDDRPAGELARLGKAPSFSLRTSDGGTLASRDLAGMVWIADFIFTHCAADCPMMTSKLSALQDSIPADLPVRFVSISVDPDRDSPEVLSAYGTQNHADRKRWFFLTGPFPKIREIAEKGFHLGVGAPSDTAAAPPAGGAAGTGGAGEPAGGFEIIHSSRFVLVDAKEEIRGYYDGTDDAAVGRLRADVVALVHGSVEPRGGKKP